MKIKDYLALQKKTRRRPRHEEASQQTAFVRYVRLQYPTLPIIMSPIFKFAGTPLQRMKQGHRMKLMGYTPGTPDLFFPIKGKCYNGLFIEMKTAKGRLSEEQKLVICSLQENGYYVEVVFSYQDAVKVFDWYMFKV